MKIKKKLSNGEKKVMQAIWFYDKEVTRMQLGRYLSKNLNTEWHSSTLTTYLSRLKNKNFVSLKHEDKTVYWIALVTKKEYRKFVTEELIDDFYDDKTELIEELLQSQNEKSPVNL